MSPNPVPYYHTLERTGTRMVAAARHGDWNEVQRLEEAARQQVQVLRDTGATRPTTLAQRQARQAALKAVLRLDAMVRDLAEPGWVQVQHWLQADGDRRIGAWLAAAKNRR